MSETLQRIQQLIRKGEVRISTHGYEELAADDIFVREVIAGVEAAELIEDYPEYHKGPSVLVLQYDQNQQPLHIVWGIPHGKDTPAVLVTAYRPNPARWSVDFKERIT